MENIKVGFSMSPDLVSRLDDYRRSKGLTRSACVSAIIEDYFESLAIARKENERLNRFAKILSDYTAGSLSKDDFQAACSVLMKQ